jgi:sarcosine oxidase gamma subunit
MARLIARSALNGVTSYAVDGIGVSESPPLTAWLITNRDGVDLLVVGVDRPPGTALAQDMTSALTYIEVCGEGALDALGLSITAGAEHGATATRLADSRVFIEWRKQPAPWLRIAVERSSADYFWHWLKHRIEVWGAGHNHT